MEVIRLQNKTPSVYTEESKDFQLLCRLYDCIVNGVKFDVDTMQYITDSAMCRTNILQLLQTKVGFFTELNMTDDALRYILRAFPTIIKSKGALKSIEQAINVFLKIYHINTAITVWYVQDSTMVYNTLVDDHTIIVGMNTAMKDISILEEVFKYILPTGFGFYFYFYNKIEDSNKYDLEDKAVLLFTSENVASNVRGNFVVESNGTEHIYSDPLIAVDSENRLIGAVDTLITASYESQIPTIISSIIEEHSADKYYTVGSMVHIDDEVYVCRTTLNKYLGTSVYYVGDLVYYDGEYYVCKKDMEHPSEFDLEYWNIINNYKPLKEYHVDDYASYNGKIYKCISDVQPSEEWNASNWQLIHDGRTRGVFYTNTDKWEKTNSYDSSYISKFRGVFKSENDVQSPSDDDVILVHDSTVTPRVDQAKLMVNREWKDINFIGLRDSLPSVANEYDVVGIYSRQIFYRYVNDTWELLNYRGKFDTLDDVTSPSINDVVEVVGEDRKMHYWVYIDRGILDYEWRQQHFLGEKHSFPKFATSDDMIILDGVSYYIYRENSWHEDTKTLFMLRHVESDEG